MSILPRRLSIKYRMAASFSAAIAVILLASGLIIYAAIYNKVRSNTVERLAISTASLKNVVEQGADMAMHNHLRTLAKANIAQLEGLERLVQSGQLDAVEARAKGEKMLLRQSIGANGSIYALSSQGIALVHTNPALRHADLSAHQFVQQQMFSKNGYLEYEWQNPDDAQVRSKALYMLYFAPWDWIVSVSCDRRDMSFLTNDLRRGLKSYRFGQMGYTFVITAEGTLLLHPWLQGNVFLHTNTLAKSVFHRMVTMKKGMFRYAWQDKEDGRLKQKIISFDYIPDLRWIVGSTVYEDEVFAPLSNLGRIIGLVVVGALAVAILFCLFFGSMITTPLSRLAGQMQRAIEGDTRGRADEEAPGEIGLLGLHVNTYVDRFHRPSQIVHIESDKQTQTEQQLHIYRQAVESALEGIVITDASANILAVNRAFTEITGYSAEEVQGCNCRILQSGRHGREFYERLWRALVEDGRWSGEIWNRRKSGEIYPQILSISAINDSGNTLSHCVGLFHDISTMKHQEERIVHQAYHDILTGLPNRCLALDRIKVSIAHVKRRGTKLAVVLLDLDNFKNVNDTLGHEYGDMLLMQVAKRLVAALREEDTVARQGGDEFLILVAAIATESVLLEMVKRLMGCFADPFNVAGNDLYITASVGVALYPAAGDDAGTLTKHADIAMYHAKAKGKNNYCLFTSDLGERITMRQQLEIQLRQAVFDSEFTVFFQPKFEPVTNTVVGAEALVRCLNKDGCEINLSEFISLAEETNLIVPLGEQILEYVCQVLCTLEYRGYPDLTIAVNLSPLQFAQENLVEQIAGLLAKYNIAGSRLELEVTETTIMTNLANTVATLDKLVQLGIAVAIDDFGTGYSSLSYLKQFPVRTLKIDRSFIRDLPDDASDAQLVETIMLMAHNLGISVVAEGVETEAQVEWLKRYRCEQIQGFVYSKPLPVDEFIAFLDANAVVGKRESTACIKLPCA
ncbi:MAG: EAL domain-containing protein [Desulfobulbus sp.]|jgi:diguanylate cyclase (GGDEF)-like protein/PAS domain S-box-containing protein|uniref:bifunctional diguanylate cyclase/phosphodiesterase n=1 Tax=Desulfobulbus sp. TaxID=895 RepID=UPI00284CAC82|nr:EAL domain-containing protein [Desulfobulbus sp.]MDR2551035.1 EAL domain-containing protein [Desulfobulbus sp.]